jgi:hypothetical protein
MMHKLLALLASLLFLAGPAAAIEETLRITASAATATQNSETIHLPPTVNGIIVTLDVTGGATLLLDINVEAYSPGAGAWFAWAGDCPSSGGVTGVSVTRCFFGPKGSSSGGHYAINDLLVMLPTVFRVSIVHGNANAATYTVRTIWVRK